MNSQEQQNEQEQKVKSRRRRIRPTALLLWGLILLLILGAVYFFFLRKRSGFTQVQIEKSFAVAASSRAGMAFFSDGLLRYSEDGISFLDEKGREHWNINVTMNDPRFIHQGKSGAVADLGGQTVVVFDEGGEMGRYQTADPIIGLAVSSSGITAVALERDLNSRICFYNSIGTRLDIEISLEMSVSGFPLAMALSPDGSGLVLSMVSSQGGNVNSQLVFYNFTVGKSEANRLVGYFNHEGHLLTQIDYLGAKRVAAVCDDALEIYSLEQENKPELKERIPFPGEVSVYTAAGSHEAFLYPDPGSGNLTLAVYDSDGREAFNKIVGNEPRRLVLGEDLVLLLCGEDLSIWNYQGDSYFEGSLPRQSARLFLFGKKLVQFDGAGLVHYRFK